MYSARYSCQILMKSEFSQKIFDKYSNIKFRENPSSGSQAVPCGQTDMTKLTVAFRNFANAPKNTQNATQGIPTRSRAVQVITAQAYTIRDADMPSNAFVIIVLDAFAYWQKTPICFVMYVCRLTCNSTAPTGRIFVNSNIGDVYKSLSRKSRWCHNPCDLNLNMSTSFPFKILLSKTKHDSSPLTLKPNTPLLAENRQKCTQITKKHFFF